MKKYLITVFAVFKANTSWFTISAAIYLLSSIWFYSQTGAINSEADGIFSSQVDELLQSIIKIVEDAPLLGVILIFVNNLLTMLQMLILGVILGLSPLLTLVVNGAVTGIVISLAAQDNISWFALVILGLIPHGIFELFSFFLCSAFGLKLGYHCTLFPISGKTRKESFRHIWHEIITVLPFVMILLLIAAFIEVFITPSLLSIIW